MKKKINFSDYGTLLSRAEAKKITGGAGAECGAQGGGALCPQNLCCSQWGWCGATQDYCGEGCQSQCSDGGGGCRVRCDQYSTNSQPVSDCSRPTVSSVCGNDLTNTVCIC